LSGIKKLTGQTLWYGLPTIASRFLGYLMNMALPFFIDMPSKTADLVQVYTLIPFLNVLYAYGMETAYFRFSQTHDKQKLYNTLSLSMLTSSILFSIILLFCQDSIATATDLTHHRDFILWMIAIITIDNLNTLPFARLRQENRPRKYALARITGIVVNIATVVFFMGIVPSILAKNPDNFLHHIYNKELGIGYYLVGNLFGSLFTLLVLSKEIKQVRFTFDLSLWKEVMKYSYPLIIVGLGGMVNDVLSRLIYRHVVHLPEEQANHELGVFANIFRLALLITIMIQAFRMAAEPFFFNQSKSENAPATYARIMKFFVIVCCFMFLGIGLFLDVLQWFFLTFSSKQWVEGFLAIPILALGNIFLGIYYNLSIWYKLTNKNLYGSMITIAGAAITIVLNILLIPKFHYYGSAWATFTCYFFMMISSYWLGKKHFPVPYPVRKISGYILFSVLAVVSHQLLVMQLNGNLLFSISLGLLMILSFVVVVGRLEKKEISTIPFLARLYKK
jgi:O-antigen/teichoic acid export membrane protein